MITCEGLRKTYIVRERQGFFRPAVRREIPALTGVTVTIAEGQIVGLLGPNGAGKSTLLKTLATLLVPDAGTVRVAGLDPVTNPRAVRQKIGLVLASDRSLYWKLTARENLAIYGGLHDLPAKAVAARGADLLGEVGLSDFANVAVEKYSTGMRKRLMIARALLHRPAVLILDEPTAGLDVQGRHDLWRLLKQLARSTGVTTMLATHDMEEAETVPERLLLICRGQLHADGTPADFRRETGRDSLSEAFLALTGSPLEEEADEA